MFYEIEIYIYCGFPLMFIFVIYIVYVNRTIRSQYEINDILITEL